MKEECRFSISVIGRTGTYEFAMEDFDSHEVMYVNHTVNESHSLTQNVLYAVCLFELIGGKYCLVREVNFIDCEPESFRDTETLIKSIVWHYNEDRLIVFCDEDIRCYIESYRMCV